MVEADSAPHGLTEREPRSAPQRNETSLHEGLHPWDQPTSGAGAITQSCSQDIEELEAIQRYKRIMLDDAASSTSFGKGGACLPRATQVRGEHMQRSIELMFPPCRDEIRKFFSEEVPNRTTGQLVLGVNGQWPNR